MATVVLQILAGILLVAFGLLGVLAGRELRDSVAPQRLMWFFVGATFCLKATIFLPQVTAAAAAFAAGSGSSLYDGFLYWSPVADSARLWIAVAFAVVLLAISTTRRFDRVGLQVGLAVLLLAGGVGAAAGWLIRTSPFGAGITPELLLNLAEELLLAAALLLLLVRNMADHLLWLALLTYWLFSVAATIFLVAWAQYQPSGWYPSPRAMNAIGVTAYLVMVTLAVRRLALARRGVPVPALLEWVDQLVRPGSFMPRR